jgi:mono/diheme cytochrome c family protein
MARNFVLFGGIGLIILSLLTLGGFASPAVSPVQDDVKQVYLNKCAVCHGEDGAGKTAKGKKLKMKDIRAPEVQKLTPAQWTETILKGSGQDMDGFEKELGAEMARKLATYMRDLSKK